MQKPLIAGVIAALGVNAPSAAIADALEGKKSSADILAAARDSDWRALDPENTLYIELDRGRVVVMLSPHLARNHVRHVKALAREGFYDGLSFYRVIEGFVAQGGDPFEARKTKTSEKVMKAEFEEAPPKGFSFKPLPDSDGYAPQIGFADSLPVGADAELTSVWGLHCAGAFAFARDEARDTASTEFYVTLQPQRYLDRNLSVAGRVVSGMEHLQALRRVSPPEKPEDDIGEAIKSIRVAADVPQAERTPLEILRTDTDTFIAFAEARRNRPEAFFYFRPDHLDPCQLSIPTRIKAAP